MQYAGNVLVYGAMSPCDGDWFGGVNNSNAAEFLSGVLDAEVCGISSFEVMQSPRPLRYALLQAAK